MAGRRPERRAAWSGEVRSILALHAVPGLVVLVLGLFRIGWRHLDPPPPLPGGLPRWELAAARATHLALLLVMLLLPLTGLLSVLFGFRPFEVRWLGTITPLAGVGWLHEGAETIHVVLGKAFLVLFLAHLGAVIWHAVSQRFEILGRMIPLGDR
ncbi:MAG: cytochrome b/b6 domain-containing protein [Geminicoccaceae bacterium]